MNAMVPAETVAGVAFHETDFTALRHEGAPLFALHWLEASADRAVPLDIDWDAYARMEAAGAMLTVAARRGEALVGYAVYVVWPHLHYRGRVVADSDSFFLHPRDRRGAVGVKLFRVAEELLRRRGVAEIWNRERDHVRPGRGRSTLAPIFRRLGYRPAEHVWRKRIG